MVIVSDRESMRGVTKVRLQLVAILTAISETSSVLPVKFDTQMPWTPPAPERTSGYVPGIL